MCSRQPGGETWGWGGGVGGRERWSTDDYLSKLLDVTIAISGLASRLTSVKNTGTLHSFSNLTAPS